VSGLPILEDAGQERRKWVGGVPTPQQPEILQYLVTLLLKDLLTKFQYGSLFFFLVFGDLTVDINRSPETSKVDVDCRLGGKELPLARARISFIWITTSKAL
jgi:hypothetical protein